MNSEERKQERERERAHAKDLLKHPLFIQEFINREKELIGSLKAVKVFGQDDELKNLVLELQTVSNVRERIEQKARDPQAQRKAPA